MLKRFLALVLAAAFSFAALPAIADIAPSGLPAVSGNAAAADILVGNHSGTTSKFTLTQVWTPTGPLIFAQAGTFGTGSQTYCAQDAGAIAGFLCNIPTSSTNGYRWQVNNATIASLTAAGLLTAGQFAGSGAGLTSGTVPNAALVTTPLIATGGAGTAAAPLSFMRNKIIDGQMWIDQRNNGASITPSNGQYSVDRWFANLSQASKFTLQQTSPAAPATGFVNALHAVSSSAYTVLTGDFFTIAQAIEGFNIADLSFGTANAKPISLEFWVRSSLTGTFGGSITNYNNTQSYPFTYTYGSANTWVLETVQNIPGDTTGTWATGSSGAMTVYFGLGVGTTKSGTAGSWSSSAFLSATGAVSVVGTSGASLDIAGVRLESGTTSTPFEQRPYGTELALAQRYCYVINAPAGTFVSFGMNATTTGASFSVPFPVTMRVSPGTTTTFTNPTNFAVNDTATAVAATALSGSTLSTQYNGMISLTAASGLTAFRPGFLYTLGGVGQIIFSADL